MASSEKLAQIGLEALKRFDQCYLPSQEIRLQCLEDRRFCYVPSAQWEGGLGEFFANRIRFEINKLQMSVVRIMNEYQNNPISVKFRANDSKTSNDDADTLNGLFRADVERCNGQEAFDNAFNEACVGGMGAYKICSEYEDEYDEDDERQRLVFEPIYDADQCVFFDNAAKRQDKSDAKWCFNIASMTREDYEDKYGKEVPSSFNKVNQLVYEWFSNDLVRVAEYYEVELKKETVETYKLAISGEEQKLKTNQEDYEQAKADLIAQGFTLEKSKKVKCKKIHAYVLDGQGIIEDLGYILGSYLPIIPVYGKRLYVGGIERISGHVRLAKDPQQLYNMMISSLAESAAESGVQVPIFTPAQIAGHEHNWAEHQVNRLPYLLLNPTIDQTTGNEIVSPMQFTQPPAIPPAMAALIQEASAAVAELTGGANAGEKIVSNVSAEAIDMVQKQIDMQAFVYISNFGKAMRHGGCVWLSMAQEGYDEDSREMRTVSEDGQQSSAYINQPTMKDGIPAYKNDVVGSKFDVTVDVAPSFTSRRDSTVKNLINMLPRVQDPETANILQSMVLNNMDGEGLADIRAYTRKKLVSLGVAKPTDEEAKEIAAAQASAQNAPPSAQDQALLGMAAESQAKANKAQAETQLTFANANNKDADTIQKLFDVQAKQQEQQNQMAQGMAQVLQMLSAMQQAHEGQQQQIEANVAQSPIPVDQLPQMLQQGNQPPNMAEGTM